MRERGLSPLFYLNKKGMITSEKIRSLIEEKIAGTEVYIVDVITAGKSIQVQLDTDEGITVGECSEVGRYLANHEEMTEVMGIYHMEVGSPGISQSLKLPRQYKKRVGSDFNILAKDNRELKGALINAGEEGIELEEEVIRKEGKKKITEKVIHKLNYSEIKEAKLQISFGTKKKK